MKRLLIIILLMIFNTILFSCKNDFIEFKNEDNKNRHIIIDTDTGADDASAIIMAAKDKDAVDFIIESAKKVFEKGLEIVCVQVY